MFKKHLWPLLATLFAVALVAAACGDDATTEAASGADDEMADMADDEMADGGHDHSHSEPIEVPDGMAVPTIAVTAEPDSVSGHNLFIELTDFEISAENASTEPVDGQGHLHLYVDGERVMRFYNQALHLTGLHEGEHEVMVEISANNHSAYAVDGEPIRAMTTVTVEPTEGDTSHDHGGDELATSERDLAIGLEVGPDPKSGWNVRAITSNFEFAPESVGGEHVDGEGHVHLYVNDVKVARVYGEWWHIAELPAGSNEIRLELSTNDHRAYAAGEETAVHAMAMIEVDEESAGGGHDDHGADDGEDAGHGHDHAGTGEMLDMATDEADLLIDVVIAGDEVTVPDRRIEVAEGQSVAITVESDMEEQFHLHGYDLLADIGPDMTAEIVFEADSPGVFEAELEGSGRFLFEIEVR